jgi:hypothetical protein
MSAELIRDAIVAALSAGAVTGAKDVARKAIADSYDWLKSLIKKKYGSESEASAAIDKLEARPDSEGRQKTLGEELGLAHASDDPELTSAAQALLELVRALPQGEKTHPVRAGTGHRAG